MGLKHRFVHLLLLFLLLQFKLDIDGQNTIYVYASKDTYATNFG